MKRNKKSPLLLRKTTGSDGSRTPKQTTPPSSASLGVPSSVIDPTTIIINNPNPPQPNVEDLLYFSSEELTHWDTSAQTSGLLSNGTPIPGGDEVDYNNLQRTRMAIDNINHKINRTRELIKEEQTLRDDNVNEYLKLAANADRQQILRIKNVFEKKNQKSAQLIAQLQKKLDNYGKRIQDVETHGLNSSYCSRQPREVLRDVGQGLKDVGANIKEGISGLSGTVMSKPREFAHLIKNRFGSADNIPSAVGMSTNETGAEETERNLNLHGSATFTHSIFPNSKYPSEDSSSSISGGELAHAQQTLQPQPQQSGIVTSTASDSSERKGRVFPPDDPSVQQLKDECRRLAEELDLAKSQMQTEYSRILTELHDERCNIHQLEEQMNDLIELHQNEIENLKQNITDMEEKVHYQSEERLRDVQEVLESCQTRISRMEYHQNQQLQQLVTLDLDNSTARALLLKLINVLLMVLQLLLLLVATLANIVMPFLQSRIRILTTILLIAMVVLVCRQWPEFLQHCSQVIERFLPLKKT